MIMNNQKGAVFVISLLVMMVLVVLSSVFIFRAVTEKNMSDRERKLTQALFIGESGSNAGLERLDTLINTYMLTTVNSTNPSTVSSRASFYVTSADGLGLSQSNSRVSRKRKAAPRARVGNAEISGRVSGRCCS